MKTCTVDAGCCLLTATMLPMGADWVVCVSGGAAHIGSVTLIDEEKMPRTIVCPSHRDDVIGEKIAKRLQTACSQRVTVICGIHINHATGEQLQAILDASDKLCEIAEQLLAE